MNFFKRLFSSNSQPESATTQNDVNVMEDLFIDNEPPKEEPVRENRPMNGVSRFLNQDFAYMGQSDGYVHHSEEVLNNKLKQIKADFRYELDLVIDEKSDKKMMVIQMMTETGNVSEGLTRQFEATLNDLNEKISKYNNEKENSVEDEGWVMRAVYRYREGFTKGLARYQQEKLMGISTGMFN